MSYEKLDDDVVAGLQDAGGRDAEFSPEPEAVKYDLRNTSCTLREMYYLKIAGGAGHGNRGRGGEHKFAAAYLSPREDNGKTDLAIWCNQKGIPCAVGDTMRELHFRISETKWDASTEVTKPEIKVGQIWEVITDGFKTSPASSAAKRPVHLWIGERIQILHPYEWHFRTEDGAYLHATPDMISENCRLIGTVLEPVRFANKAKLDEILRLELYIPAEQTVTE